ncbi:MAG: helix-turn-helix domain-containing protein [Thermoleophilia bacterium]
MSAARPATSSPAGKSMEPAQSMEAIDALADAVAERLAVLVGERAVRPFVDVTAASEFLGVPESWLATRARNGEAPCRQIGKYVRFDLVELREWIDSTMASGPGAGRGLVPQRAEAQRSSAVVAARGSGVPFVVPSEAA